ncbi:hypothetical protein UPYG_G00013830 [Umbra pygmaea]|uniref:AXH domain-containing protein n=1 Tax=Umbra pygmaea TaxID=75934 RepID=A0ABD0Y058_UMBPY
MDPGPDRGKECLPPKKRESRQGSADQRAALDEFKSPAVPPRTRPAGSSSGGGEGAREGGGGALTNTHTLLPPPTPPLSPAGIHMPMPWTQAYTPSFPLLPNQVAQRGYPIAPPHLLLPLLVQEPLPADSREMWSYFNAGRRDYSSSLFSSSHMFGQPSLYPPDPSLTEGRHRYLGKRPNGLDGPGSRAATASRAAAPSADYGKEPSGRARLGGGLHVSQANGRRRHPEDPAGRFQPDAFFLGSRALPSENPDSHSSPQDRDPRGMPKARTPTLIPTTSHSADTQIRRGELLDQLGGSPGEAQIYYSLGSTYPTLQQSRLSPQGQGPPYPLYSPSGSPLYSLHSLRNSPQCQPNSHGSDPKGSLWTAGWGPSVEEMRTEDFLRSADTSPEFHLSTCTVLLIAPSNTHGFNHLQVLLTDRNTQELLTVLVEYPFYVRDRGWSSCCPQKTSQLYGLSCRQLSEGDICLALTPSQTPCTHARTAPRGHRTTTRADIGAGTHREDMPPPPPPPLLHPSTAVAPLLPLPPADPKERPRPRKRRWSAPDFSSTVIPTNLPHGSKQRKWQ